MLLRLWVISVSSRLRFCILSGSTGYRWRAIYVMSAGLAHVHPRPWKEVLLPRYFSIEPCLLAEDAQHFCGKRWIIEKGKVATLQHHTTPDDN